MCIRDRYESDAGWERDGNCYIRGMGTAVVGFYMERELQTTWHGNGNGNENLNGNGNGNGNLNGNGNGNGDLNGNGNGNGNGIGIGIGIGIVNGNGLTLRLGNRIATDCCRARSSRSCRRCA